MTDVIDKICRFYPNLETLTIESYELYYFLYGTRDKSAPEKFQKLTSICVSLKNYIQLPLDKISLSEQKMESKKADFMNYLRKKCPKITNFQIKDERGETINSEDHFDVEHFGNTKMHQLTTFTFQGKSV